jgi:hypothetical protein
LVYHVPSIFKAEITSSGTFVDKDTEVTLKCHLFDQDKEITDGLTYQWLVFKPDTVDDGSDYEAINDKTSDNITLKHDDIEGIGSYGVKITYLGKDYYAYITIQDKYDPLQAEIFCTLGDKIVNH